MNGGRQPLRIALVTRSFWPQTGGAEKLMGRLAIGLQERQAKVQIVTAQWNTTWPISQDWHGVSLTRIPQPKQRFWGTLCYMRGLRNWLREYRESIDIVYVSMLKQDAYVALREYRRHRPIPVVLRAEGGGLGGDAQWQDSHWLGRVFRRTCRTADAIVAPSDQIQQELMARQYDSDKV
ncbi:MAG: glycosyltransferase family 4 protein, partial [Planctomycetota bacterium]|nr:glycosyltransferase family 4 protein [Planctomycetota bacterium]